MKIAVITRFHYKDEELFKKRFDYFKREVLPRLKNQTYKKFDICVWCEDNHKKLFEDLGIKTFKAKYEEPKEKLPNLYDFNQWETVEGLDKYDLQIALDSDDLPHKNLIKTALKLTRKEKGRVLLSFQPIKYEEKTGKKYIMRNYEKTKRCSPCYAIKQDLDKDYLFLYFRSHFRMCDEKWDKIIYVEGLVTMTINDYNINTTIKEKDILI
jgi:hypothetical protein